MKIILNQDVYNLGEEGDICKVANGYGRNFLIPQKMAVLFNKQNVAEFESKKAAIEKRKDEKRQISASLKEKIEAITLELIVSSGDSGKLFGSVTNANIAEELKKEGVIIERKKIELPEHTLKMVGEYFAKIKLYGNETVDLKVILKSDKAPDEPVKIKNAVPKKSKVEPVPEVKTEIKDAAVEVEVSSEVLVDIEKTEIEVSDSPETAADETEVLDS